MANNVVVPVVVTPEQEAAERARAEDEARYVKTGINWPLVIGGLILAYFLLDDFSLQINQKRED